MSSAKPLRSTFKLLCILFLLSCTSFACFVTPTPDLRGWQCELDRDCTQGLFCVRKSCRPLCTDDLDCQKALRERCAAPGEGDTNTYCLPPCLAGTTRPCYTGKSDTKDKGICKSGTQSCTAQLVWGACKGEVLPQKEECNDKDDDCNGQTDETCTCKPGEKQPCYSGTPATKDKGTCKSGSKTCLGSGKWGECSGQTLPAKETCNGKDDDCNGTIDDNVPEVGKSCPVPGQKGKCATGIYECKFGTPSCKQTQFKTRETCDNSDNDCDGIKDNNPAGAAYSVTQPCFNGKSGCKWDSNLSRYLCTSPCRIGAQKCLPQQGSWSQTCQGEIQPLKEECNGKDDDCNGVVDDNVAEVGTACQTQSQGVCKDGTKKCTNGKLICETPLPSTDICDGKDNDCNGKIDDGCPTGQSCTQGKCQ